MKRVAKITLALAVLTMIILQNTSFAKEKTYIEQNCPHDYWGVGGDFIDCKNSLLIERITDPNQNVVFVQDIRNYFHDGEPIVKRIAPIYKYQFVEDELYVILNPDKETYYNFDLYFQNILIDGELEFLHFSSKGDIPIYRKINSVTGDHTLYKTLDEIPASDRRIFENLEESPSI